MPRPWLSVVMPTYNGARFLRQALDSVVAQRERAIEVIVVDDGSEDDTLRIAASYENKLPLVIEALPHGGNWVANTNQGMRLARGAYLSILHQDDAWRPRRLAVLKQLLRAHRKAALFVHPCWYMDAHDRRIGYWHCPFPMGATLLSPQRVLERLLVQCLYATPAPLFPARAARDVGLMDESLWFSADWDFWLKLSRLGYTVYCPTPLAMFRLHSASQTIARGRCTDEVYEQQHCVQERHRRFLGDGPVADEVGRVARFSAEVNSALLRLVDGRDAHIVSLAASFAALGPTGWVRYFRDSRIVERCLSRWQAGAVGWRRKVPRASTLAAPCEEPADAEWEVRAPSVWNAPEVASVP